MRDRAYQLLNGGSDMVGIECKACGRLSALTAENCAHIRGSQPASATDSCGVRKLLFFLLLIAPILTTITPICASNAHG